MLMEPVKIDINDYVQTGAGANGSSYDSKFDHDIMVKLYNTNYPVQPIFDELEVAQKAYSIGVPSPAPGEIVTDGERLGIRFKRIAGKRSFSRMFADEPERTEEFARYFARFCKKLHSIECPEGMFPNGKDLCRNMLGQMDFFTADEKAFLYKLIDELPEATTALHGDMHIGNVICTLPKGAPLSSPHETYFIDMGYFSYGYPLLDLGMMMSIGHYSSEEFIKSEMHITKAHSEQILEYFLDEYFFAEDKLADKWFGAGQTMDSLLRNLRKSFCLKSILIAFNMGYNLPEFERVLHDLMQEA